MYGLTPDSCAQSAVSITKADSDLSVPVRSLFVGTGGDVRVTTVNGHDVLLKNIANGSLLPISVKRVWSTNTTAGDFIGLS